MADPLLQEQDGMQQEGRQVQHTAHTPSTPGEPCCLHRSEGSEQLDYRTALSRSQAPARREPQSSAQRLHSGRSALLPH